jgi:drug/metabolite transporter (DMT)-like permease
MELVSDKNEHLLIKESEEEINSRERKKFLIGYTYNILSILSFFFTNFFSKYQLIYIPDLEVNVNQFFRCLVMLLLSIIHILVDEKDTHKESMRSWRNIKYLSLNAFFGHFVFIFFILSCFYIRYGSSYTLLYTYPILTAILAAIILKERYSMIDFYGLVVGFISVCLITKLGYKEAPFESDKAIDYTLILIGIAYGFLSSVSLALEQITIKYLSHTITKEVISFFLSLFGCMLALLFMFILGESFRYDFLFLVFSSILGVTTFYGNFFLLLSFQYISLMDTLVINFVTIFFSFIFGMIFFSNTFDIYDILGSIFLIAFNVYYAKMKYKESHIKNN